MLSKEKERICVVVADRGRPAPTIKQLKHDNSKFHNDYDSFLNHKSNPPFQNKVHF